MTSGIILKLLVVMIPAIGKIYRYFNLAAFLVSKNLALPCLYQESSIRISPWSFQIANIKSSNLTTTN